MTFTDSPQTVTLDGVHELDDRDRQREVGRSRQRTPQPTHYQLDVIGAHVADVVNAAGGWLFDRVMAGWDVRVAVADTSDRAALQILGVQPVALTAVCGGAAAPTALAVAGPLCAAVDQVRETLAASVHAGRAEVTVWGDLRLPSVGHTGVEVRHELSAAARVFKAQAAVAAGLDSAVASFEAFRSYGQSARIEHPDLLPVS